MNEPSLINSYNSAYDDYKLNRLKIKTRLEFEAILSNNI